MRRGLDSELGHGSYGRVDLGTKGIPGRDDCKDAFAIETLRDEKADVSKGHHADAEFADAEFAAVIGGVDKGAAAVGKGKKGGGPARSEPTRT